VAHSKRIEFHYCIRFVQKSANANCAKTPVGMPRHLLHKLIIAIQGLHGIVFARPGINDLTLSWTRRLSVRQGACTRQWSTANATRQTQPTVITITKSEKNLALRHRDVDSDRSLLAIRQCQEAGVVGSLYSLISSELSICDRLDSVIWQADQSSHQPAVRRFQSSNSWKHRSRNW